MPRPGQVLGLVGTNGIGKSTAIKILAGKLKPNLGKYETPPDWEEILVHFRGSDLQNYFTKVLEDTMKATMKPQYVDHIPKAVKGLVGDILKQKDEVRLLCVVIRSHSDVLSFGLIVFFGSVLFCSVLFCSVPIVLLPTYLPTYIEIGG